MILTDPILDKLDVYRGFGVREVWLFREGELAVYRLTGDDYERVERSALLPELDLAWVARLAIRLDQDEALRELRGALAA